MGLKTPLKYGILAIATLMLAGCVTAEELAKADDDKCQSYGLAKGAQPYVQCRMQLDHDRSERQVANTLATGGSVVGGIAAIANQK